MSDSAAKYIVMQGFSFTFMGTAGNEEGDLSAHTQEEEIIFQVIRPGEDGVEDDFTQHARFHVKENANGVPTAEAISLEPGECR